MKKDCDINIRFPLYLGFSVNYLLLPGSLTHYSVESTQHFIETRLLLTKSPRRAYQRISVQIPLGKIQILFFMAFSQAKPRGRVPFSSILGFQTLPARFAQRNPLKTTKSGPIRDLSHLGTLKPWTTRTLFLQFQNNVKSAGIEFFF